MKLQIFISGLVLVGKSRTAKVGTNCWTATVLHTADEKPDMQHLPRLYFGPGREESIELAGHLAFFQDGHAVLGNPSRIGHGKPHGSRPKKGQEADWAWVASPRASLPAGAKLPPKIGVGKSAGVAAVVGLPGGEIGTAALVVEEDKKKPRLVRFSEKGTPRVAAEAVVLETTLSGAGNTLELRDTFSGDVIGPALRPRAGVIRLALTNMRPEEVAPDRNKSVHWKMYGRLYGAKTEFTPRLEGPADCDQPAAFHEIPFSWFQSAKGFPPLRPICMPGSS